MARHGLCGQRIKRDKPVLILSRSGQNIGRTRNCVPAICNFVYGGCHGSVIWLPEKMKDGIPGTMFGAGSAFGPFHVFYEMR
ncbi:hypothetical protein VIGAN_06108600 [Vigna angularis var. angularis]|uniref:Uncharacterized protein n=1 Tax=Vigna angularis var. angularis TaxID=157739 RepID=A0A0S3SAV6_PHAAN|nr:hypothetical protein VIGAN_06108600 [Vigna angularis var. angularis]